MLKYKLRETTDKMLDLFLQEELIEKIAPKIRERQEVSFVGLMVNAKDGLYVHLSERCEANDIANFREWLDKELAKTT